jgi:ABC-type uncharacterized transport system involved in gliding motility auxiliary subunit
MKNLTRILLVAGILLFINLLSRQYFVRIDATKEKQYTLSNATKNILKDLDESVSITAYFTKDLPAQYAKNYTDLRDLLIEYNTRSGGTLDYEFIDPNFDPETEQEAVQNGVSPLLINVREKDQVAQKKAFMGAVISSGESSDVIPYFPPGGALEYLLTTSIKKVVAVEKPSIAISSGFGSPGMQQLPLLVQSMSVLYNVTSVDLSNAAPIDPSVQCVAIVNPQDTIPNFAFDALDTYIESGGNIAVAYNSVGGDFQSMQGTAIHTGISEWLGEKGLTVNQNFVLDASAASVTVQQRQGFFTINSQLEFPYFPMVNNFEEHPITQGLEQIAFQFVSSMDFDGNAEYEFTPLIRTSDNSGVRPAPAFFDVQRKWTRSDFPDGRQIIAGVLSPTAGTLGGKIIVFSDGDFLMGAQSRGQTPDNISLFSNAMDWLSDDTGLIDLRTKGVASRPIKEMEEAKITTTKWMNFLLPIALVIILGIVRFQRNQRTKLKRMALNYG